ncbi:MAG TPA: hypothetical protein VFV38_48040 [Ktedonobacteraceae bacterium]|nr:hypothetical protein [Ktedonobacteraceae bacterium]
MPDRANLKAMGLAAEVAGLIAAGATIIWNLTPDQEDMAQRIYMEWSPSRMTLLALL